MTAAIHFEAEAYDVTHGKAMGRHFARHGFLSAFARHSSHDAPVGYVGNAKAGGEFCDFIKNFRPESSPRFIVPAKAGALRQVGCLFTPSPINAAQTWQRELHGPRSWSLCGVNHTLSSARAMDGLTSLLAAAVQPWDAIICTSTASRAVIETLFAGQEDHLSRRLGATRFIRPQLPVIPLGVDCEAQARRLERRDEARSSLGVEPGDFVVLFLGRLSFHAKANPTPMYLALERLARRHRVVLIECGWTANDQIAQAFSEARAKLCPSVRSIVLDGRINDVRDTAWAAADVFCSLSDNIQETFGLTPIEAMAAGLPVVVTDWDGYKDTVRNGIDGFAVPTMAAPPGSGQRLATRHALEVDTYDSYIGQASTAVAVDIDATAAAFERLAADPDLRRRMGANGAARARERFDWKVIVRAYEELWRELSALRNARQEAPSPETMRGFWSARPDPFELFASFPSLPFSSQYVVSQVPGIDETEVLERLSLKASLVSASPDISSDFLRAVWKLAAGQGATVQDVLAAHRDSSPALTVRALLWLAKLGLLTIISRDERS
ncbi:glycosyltransferase family 4 protein [Microvirga arabica]|uniref:glycosyltransferase family 4 protein n=1 Tax=Microvirga arabica TaxID=1128671 RepID=UPI00193A6AD2|nr:glycosyltransferase family 4 protein [Microvirga arabica]MBM1173280.1 glycosyltransferase family 4 protein [Microvirga arabica]